LDPEQQDQIRQLLNRILDVKDMVSELQESMEHGTSPKEIESCRQALDSVVDLYNAILQQVPQEERREVERRYGRQVMDLRRHASWLPDRSRGTPAALATGSQWPNLEDLAPSLQPPLPAAAPPPDAALPSAEVEAPSGPRVGGEIEAWCGPCKGLHTHNIVAMVGGDPKQVLCRSCGARHGFRLTPARGKKKDAAPTNKKGKLTREEREHQAKEGVKAAFQKELLEAKEVKPFSTRTRYRAGEIIEHPEYGRGKIENVIRGSILVRFRAGLRPISTY